MILEELARICFEIRLLKKKYEMPPYAGLDISLPSKTITDEEADLARILYNCVKTYALANDDPFHANPYRI